MSSSRDGLLKVDHTQHGGEVQDDRDVLVSGASMPLDMLVNAQHFDPVEASRVINEQALAHQPGQSPTQAGAADFLSWSYCLAQIFTPHSSANSASVAAVLDDQNDETPAKGFVGASADQGIAGNPGLTAGAAPRTRVGDFSENLSF